MSSESVTYKFEPLKGNNWLPWKTRIDAILTKEKLSRLVYGSEKRPVAADPGKVTGEETSRMNEWDDKDGKARSIIVLNISDSEMIYVMGAKTAAEMWKKLTSVKESSSGMAKLIARRKLYRTFAEEGADITEHVTKLTSIKEELNTMGVKIEDADFLDILMTSLPESWDIFTTTYMTANSAGVKTLTPDDFIAVVYEEIRRRSARQSTSDTALKAISHTHDTSKGTRRNDDKPTCQNCKRKGHVAKNCWAPGGGKEGQGPKQRKKKEGNDRANKAEEDSPKNFDMAYTAHDDFDAPSENSRDAWWLDSCANQHLCINKALFTSYIPTKERTVGGVGGRLAVHGTGTVIIDFRVGNRIVRHQVSNVLHTPEFNCNLLSMGKLDSAGVKWEGQDGTLTLMRKDGSVIGLGMKKRDMYLLEARGVPAEVVETAEVRVAESNAKSWDEWHRQYGHLAYSAIRALRDKEMVSGLIIDENSTPQETCEACIQAKITRRPFPKESTTKTEKPGEYTVSDIWGPARVESIAKSRYYISFTDLHTRRCTVLFMRKKSEAHDRIVSYLTRIERHYGHIPKAIKFDNGKELVGTETQKWCAMKGIDIDKTSPYSPSQNGVAERFNRTLLELARAMLIARNLPTFLWAEATAHAAYLRNHAPTKALDGKTPEEAWTGRKPNVSHLQEFGCDVWIRDEGDVGKLLPRANKMIFTGFEDGPKAVRYYDPAKRSIKVSRNYVFPEKVKIDINAERTMPIEGEKETEHNQQNVPMSLEEREITHQNTRENPPKIATPNAIVPIPMPDRPVRTKRKPTDYRKLGNPDVRSSSSRYEAELEAERRRAELEVEKMVEVEDEDDEPTAAIAFMADAISKTYNIPRNIREARNSPEWKEWVIAMEEEHNQLLDTGTWELVEPVADRQAIGSRWVFAKKYDEHGNVVKHKARLVAQGFSQVPGIDYTENFAPVVRLDAVRTCIALSAIKDWEMRQLDIKGAYLNGELEEEIYMRQPEEFDDGSGRVCKLKRPLYGLKQAGRVWNKNINSQLTTFGYTRTNADPCVYYKLTHGKSVILTLWVDDIIMVGDAKEEIEDTVRRLGKHFEIKDLGDPRLLLGIQINRDRQNKTITLSQQNYITAVLERFGYSNLSGVSTPLDKNIILHKRTTADPQADPSVIKDYQTKLGCIMYAAIGTLPQLAYAVQTLSQFSTNPGPEHITALKRTFRYLAHVKSKKMGLVYGGTQNWPTEVTGYTDADWGSNPNDRLSISGFAFLLGGGAISWSSKKQTAVALSSTEAEYMAASHAARHAIWLQRLLSDIGFPISRPTTLFIDNQSTLALTQDVKFHQRTKHIDIQYHFLRDQVISGTISTFYCQTNEMIADIMTKALDRPQHTRLTEDLGVLSV